MDFFIVLSLWDILANKQHLHGQYQQQACFFLPSKPTSINNQDVTRNVGTGSAGQVDGCTLKVLGRAPSARWDTGADAGQPLRVVQERRVHVRVNVARSNGVDCDTLGCPLVGEALGHLPNGSLGGGVRGHGESALEGQQRGVVDDAASTPGDGGGFETQHVPADIATEGKDRIEVDLHDL